MTIILFFFLNPRGPLFLVIKMLLKRVNITIPLITWIGTGSLQCRHFIWKGRGRSTQIHNTCKVFLKELWLFAPTKFISTLNRNSLQTAISLLYIHCLSKRKSYIPKLCYITNSSSSKSILLNYWQCYIAHEQWWLSSTL